MKKQILTSLILLLGTFVYAGNADIQEVNAIDNMDTVFFDLSEPVITETYIEFPVWMKTDDVVNALDFAMQFDLSKLEYDTLMNLTPNLEPLANYNTNDSTLRLTSFSLDQIPNTTALVKLRFNLVGVGTQISATDLKPSLALLNGTACSYKVIAPPTSTGIRNIGTTDIPVHIFPNPVSEILNIEAARNVTVQVMDIYGKQILMQVDAHANQTLSLNVRHLASGNYLVRVSSGNLSTTKKILINNEE